MLKFGLFATIVFQNLNWTKLSLMAPARRLIAHGSSGHSRQSDMPFTAANFTPRAVIKE
jgi:hypothetical protein